jgi:parallel beta-helix repeat protein
MEGVLFRSLLCSVALAVLTAAPGAADAAPTPISRCGFAITSSGDYVLTRDLTCSDVGIEIAASDVTLDLTGRTITGMSSASSCGAPLQVGIRVTSDQGRVHVVGGTVRRFFNGMFIDGMDVTVRGTQLIENCGTGASLAGFEHQLLDMTIQGGRVGVRVLGGAVGTLISGSTISGNSVYGIELARPGPFGSDPFGNSISGNTLRDNGTPNAGAAIAVLTGRENEILSNTIEGNFVGIDLVSTVRNRIEANQISLNRGSGIRAGPGTTGNQIRGNSVRGNATGGSGADLAERLDSPCDGVDGNVWRDNEFGTLSWCACEPGAPDCPIRTTELLALTSPLIAPGPGTACRVADEVRILVLPEFTPCSATVAQGSVCAATPLRGFERVAGSVEIGRGPGGRTCRCNANVPSSTVLFATGPETGCPESRLVDLNLLPTTLTACGPLSGGEPCTPVERLRPSRNAGVVERVADRCRCVP